MYIMIIYIYIYGGKIDQHMPLTYKGYEPEISACEILIDSDTSLKLYIYCGCVPEDNGISSVMMINIENIFYIINIHLITTQPLLSL